jgi:transmembrane sensor
MTDETPELERWVLLAKYVSGECSPTDRARVERWLAADPTGARRRVLEEVRIAAVEGAVAAEPSALAAEQRESDVEWRRLAGKVDVRRRPLAELLLRRRWMVRSAASVGLLAAALVVAAVLGIGGRGMLTSRGAPASVAWREYATAPGQRETVTLLDGTQFSLAPASRVRVPLAYGRGARDLTVEGEAYFTVVHDPSQPFRVHVGNAVATDIGTRFDVRAYGGAPVVVAVAEGEVALTTGGGVGSSVGTSLRQGDVAIVGSTGSIEMRAGVELESYVGWTRGELVFVDEPLGEVLATLGRWYGVRIVLADSALARRPIRARYTTQSMTDVLALVTGAVGAHYRRDVGTGVITVLRDR